LPRAVGAAGRLAAGFSLTVLSITRRLLVQPEPAQSLQRGLHAVVRAEPQFHARHQPDDARHVADRDAEPGLAADRLSAGRRPGDFARPARLSAGRLDLLR